MSDEGIDLAGVERDPVALADLDAMDREAEAARALAKGTNGAAGVHGAPELEATWIGFDAREPYATYKASERSGQDDGDVEAPPPWASRVIVAPAAWYTTAPAARAWLLRDGRTGRGLLPLGKVGQVIAEGGAGKTMAVFQLAISVATLVPWLGTFDVAIPGEASGDGKRRPRTGRVVAVEGEEDAEECHRRLYNARRAMNAPAPPEGSIVVLPLAGVPCPMLARDEHGEPVDAPFLAWLRSYVEANGPWDLIIVDPLSRFAGRDAEIDNAVATRFIQSLESIATLTGATVLVCHHTNKLARRGGAVEAVAGRGSSALVDGARWQCSLGSERLKLEDPAAQERLGTIVTWAHTKSNYSPRADELVLRSDRDNGGALVALDAADLEAVQGARGVNPVQVAKDRAKDVQRGTREAAEDAAVLRAVADRPGIATRDLATAVQAGAHCGRDRAYVAIERVRDQLDVREGLRKARLHYPRESGPGAANA